MKALEILVKRLAFGFVTAWAVLTTVFLVFTATDDWVAARVEGQVRWAMTGPDPEDPDAVQAAVDRELAEYTAERELDRPLYEQYLDWMWNVATLDWGYSLDAGEAVFPLVASATIRTATYVVPAIVLAVALGTLIGLYAALNPDSRLAHTGRVGSYLLFALPSFWIGGLFVSLVEGDVVARNPLLYDHVLPIALVTTTLLGGYVSYSRAHALEYATADFVTLVRAKGAGPLDVTRHVVRNAAIPMFSMLFTEAVGLLVLSIFVVEVLFGIEGFALTFFFAVDARDVPVLLGSTMIIIAVGVMGNVVQDLSYQYLDPRVEGDG